MDKEKCLIVGIDINDKSDTESDMEELTELVNAANGNVISTIIQKRENIDYKYYIGKGKIEEIVNYIDELDIDTIVMNGQLTGSQINNIEKALSIKVIDRTMLILDIFSKRAFTKEGKLQVELAQLKYSLPRLKGIGKSLSRQGGGIGTRGPGEKKLETDRRHILSRIKDLELQLKRVEKTRNTKRKQRLKEKPPIISIVGYTNVGKSTLLNSITNNTDNKKVFSHDMLFATLETELRKTRLPGGNEVIFSDTVGFVKELPTELIEAFKGTLEEIKYADIILHVMNINDKNILTHKKVTLDIVNSIITKEVPIINVYNKIDLSENNYIEQNDNNSVYISAKEKTNVNNLLEKIDTELYGPKKVYKLRIPNESIKVYYHLYSNRKILTKEHKDKFTEIDVILYQSEMGLYKEYIVEE